jgi:hypothetical protein
MVLGHLTVTAAGHRILRQRLPFVSLIPLGALLVGAYVPDLVDKPLNHVTGLSGRGYGHALTVQAVVFALAWLLLRRHRLPVLATALGAAIHLAEDWVGAAVLFAPFLGTIPPAPPWGFMESMIFFYSRGGPLVWLEVAGVLYWLAVALRRLAGERTAPDGQATA